MKRLLVLIGITAGMATSLLAQTANDSPRPVSTPKGAARAKQNAAVARAIREHRAVYFISNTTSTGSHIPQVVCHYEGRNTNLNGFTNGRIYNSGDLGLTGSLNVGGALYSLDPAISIR